MCPASSTPNAGNNRTTASADSEGHTGTCKSAWHPEHSARQWLLQTQYKDEFSNCEDPLSLDRIWTHRIRQRRFNVTLIKKKIGQCYLLEYGCQGLNKTLSDKAQCVTLKEWHTSWKSTIYPRNIQVVKWYQKNLSVNSGYYERNFCFKKNQ